ncbi:MAG: response regulator transcription factor [Oscillospiraceae bacterium]|nr:response regulator transcription factor [Oscillospiraceae bacterium]
MAQRILIVEDEEKIARFVELELQHEGYETEKTADGRAGLELAQSGRFDLVLLDIMLPSLNGIEIVRRLRRSSDVPVIMVTARDAVMDKVSGLDMGADDYITKPFAIEELLARIRALLRKKPRADAAGAQSVLVCGALSLDRARHAVSYAGSPVELTSREFAMLELLLENKNIVLSRETFLERVWGYDYVGETNVVDVYVRYLRAKLDDVFGVQLIRTVRGVGYVLRDGGR